MGAELYIASLNLSNYVQGIEIERAKPREWITRPAPILSPYRHNRQSYDPQHMIRWEDYHDTIIVQLGFYDATSVFFQDSIYNMADRFRWERIEWNIRALNNSRGEVPIRCFLRSPYGFIITGEILGMALDYGGRLSMSLR